jgi:ferredoxin
MTHIFCFTGTGNSLLVARMLGHSLGGATVQPMEEMTSARIADGDSVGLVFPVYFLGLPRIVAERLRACDLGKGTYVFAAATNGGDVGNTLDQADRVLRAKGLRLNLGVEIPMGDNSLALATTPEVLRERMEAVPLRVESLARAVADRMESSQPYRRTPLVTAYAKAMKAGFDLYYRPRKGAANKAVCTGCGLCSRLCPTGTIELTGGFPAWGGSCAYCFACVNWCPRGAVSLGRLSPGVERQYRCPGITAADLMARPDGQEEGEAGQG